MRPIWSGGITFGLIYIPINLYNAIDTKSLKFHYLRKKDLCPIKYIKVCKDSHEEVPFDEIVKGFEYEKDKFVIMEDGDFENANVEKSKSIEIIDFVDNEEIDCKYFEKPYYLEPDEEAGKTYTLLLKALEKSGKVGIGKFVLRNREKLVALKPDNGKLVLIQLRFAEELQDAKELQLPKKIEVEDKELDLAVSIIGKMSARFNPEKYKDTYSEELQDAIKEKVIHHKIKPRGKVPAPTKVVDLMAKLQKSLELAHK